MVRGEPGSTQLCDPSIDLNGSTPPPNSVSCLEQRDRAASIGQIPRGAQASKATADHDYMPHTKRLAEA
jgi:hypothetical protein